MVQVIGLSYLSKTDCKSLYIKLLQATLNELKIALQKFIAKTKYLAGKTNSDFKRLIWTFDVKKAYNSKKFI